MWTNIYEDFSKCKKMVYTIDLYDYLHTNGIKANFTTTELGLVDSYGELVS